MVSVEVFISTKLWIARHDARHGVRITVGDQDCQALLAVKIAIQERAPALHLRRIVEHRGKASLILAQSGIRRVDGFLVAINKQQISLDG
jgi:hypothetical protein